MTSTNKNVENRNAGRRPILWATIFLMFIFTVLSIFGAFIGADRASQFFASTPLVMFWLINVVLLCVGFALLANLRKKPGLLLSHLGCLLVLLGSLWGSEGGHELRAKYLNSGKVAKGYMQIHEGHQKDTLVAGDGSAVLGTLPFSVALDDFWIEYYEVGGILKVSSESGKTATIPAVAGEKLELGDSVPALEISRVFRNFRIHIEEGARRVSDAPGGDNPALAVVLTDSDGGTSEHYVFTGAMAGHGFSYGGLDLVYEPAGVAGIKDYKSSLAVIEDGKVVKRQVIEVNKPLHYGGYDFYQSSYDQKRGHYTILSVTSDSGLILVFPGYLMLCLGVLWQLWFRHLAGYMKART